MRSPIAQELAQRRLPHEFESRKHAIARPALAYLVRVDVREGGGEATADVTAGGGTSMADKSCCTLIIYACADAVSARSMTNTPTL